MGVMTGADGIIEMSAPPSATTPSRAPVVIETRNGHLIATLTSRVPSATEVQAAQQAIVAALSGFEGKGRCYVLDLSQIAALSSLGIGLCLDTRHRAVERGLRPILVGLQPPMLNLLRTMKVDRLFTIFHDESELSRMLSA
ncbi:MAG: STAS domain-containing protein [Phycisphaeraceae bacterium]|nr:STAS domain-containing protein [Phycisphaeraceae bacterium]